MTKKSILEECSDAIMKFRDGVTMRCSKYIMISTFGVFKIMLECSTEMENGKFVIYIPEDCDVCTYEYFIDISHGVTTFDKAPLETLMNLVECFDKWDSENLIRLSLEEIRRRDPLIQDILKILPRIFMSDNAGLITRILEKCCIEYPLWIEFEANVLAEIKYHIDPRMAKNLLRVQKFFPPSAISKWLLKSIDTGIFTEDDVVDIITTGSFYIGVEEYRSVTSSALDIFSLRPTWSKSIQKMIKSNMYSCSWNNSVPTMPGGVSGYHIMFDGVPQEIVFLSFPQWRTHTKKKIMISPYIRISMPLRKTDFSFEIKRGQDFETGAIQVRLTASRSPSLLNPIYEALYDFHTNVDEWTMYTEAVDTVCTDKMGELTQQLRRMREQMYVRFDVRFRYGVNYMHDIDLTRNVY